MTLKTEVHFSCPERRNVCELKIVEMWILNARLYVIISMPVYMYPKFSCRNKNEGLLKVTYVGHFSYLKPANDQHLEICYIFRLLNYFRTITCYVCPILSNVSLHSK